MGPCQEAALEEENLNSALAARTGNGWTGELGMSVCVRAPVFSQGALVKVESKETKRNAILGFPPTCQACCEHVVHS